MPYAITVDKHTMTNSSQITFKLLNIQVYIITEKYDMIDPIQLNKIRDFIQDVKHELEKKTPGIKKEDI
jgi:hypothetical protein